MTPFCSWVFVLGHVYWLYAIPEPLLIMIYLLTAIRLTPGGSSTVHIYTKQYSEQPKKNRQYIEQHKKKYIEQHKNKLETQK
jgi:hypothetical protein